MTINILTPILTRLVVFVVLIIFLMNFQISVASAALDLAHISQTSPRAHFTNRALEKDKSSEWPQFNGNRLPEGPVLRNDRRTVTNPNVTLSTPESNLLGSVASASSTPLLQQQPTTGQTPNSRR